jgi:prenyltransferase beta subunit
MNHPLSRGKGFLLERNPDRKVGVFILGTGGTMRKHSVVLITVLVVLLASALPVLASTDLDAALDYLSTQQNVDGGFGSGFSPESALGSTADAVLAIVAAGADLATFDQGGNTPLTYLAANAPSAVTGGDLAKLILAAVAAGQNPRALGGVDSVAKLEGMIGADGRIGGEMDTFVAHVLAVLALRSAERPIPAETIAFVTDAQQEGGGWAWDGSAETTADTNTTAFAVQALIAGGEAPGSAAVSAALAYYEGIQNDDGGWPYQSPSDFGTATDTNSTAVTIQALLAAGQDAAGEAWTTSDAETPFQALEELQNESGAFAWQVAMPDDNLLATVQALPALAGKPFPLATMHVGDAAESSPGTLPATGGAVPSIAMALVASGLALAAGGFAYRRR